MDAQFIISAAKPEQFPDGQVPQYPEVAFLGRSNVGKSSLLNALLGQPGLAFTSSRPGCTQLINFFRVGKEYIFADLPGYGFAQVPVAVKQEWQALIEAYLLSRERLALCVLLLDSRRGWMDSDVELKDWLDFHKRPYIVAATKIDKLKTQSERHQSMKALREQYPEGTLVPVSAPTGRGLKELWQAIATAKNQGPA